MTRLILQLLCMAGIHYRSRRAVRQHGLRIRSQCKGCQRPMVKEGNHWRVAARHEHSARV